MSYLFFVYRALILKRSKRYMMKLPQKQKENQSLINLRDTLLPKLMSGEISLNKNMGSIDD